MLLKVRKNIIKIVILCLSLYPDLKDDKSVCGEIGDMTWGLTLSEYKNSLNIHKKKTNNKIIWC